MNCVSFLPNKYSRREDSRPGQWTRYFLLLPMVFSLGVPTCGSKNTGRPGPLPPGLTDDQARMLESLEKIDDYPLYVLKYTCGYGFSDYLKRGIPGSPTAAESNPEAKENGWQCTSFVSFGTHQAVFGHNFDWHNRESLLLFTDPPDGYASVSMVDMFYCFNRRQSALASLEDRKGLLNAPYCPFDGMNEKGVAIGLMSVPHAEPPRNPAKITIDNLAVIRLVLDRAASVPEALELMGSCNVHFSQVPLHYLVADRSGRSLIVEYYRGQVKTFPGNGSSQVCTNFILAEAGQVWNRQCWRYDLASRLLKKTGGNLSPKQGMKILEKVSQPHTVWSIVYDLHTGQVAVTMGRKYRTLHRFHLPLTPWIHRQ